MCFIDLPVRFMKILFKNNTYNNAFYNNCSKIIFFGARKQELNRDTVSFSFKSKEMSKEEKEALVVEAIKKQNPKKNSEIEQALQKQEVDLIASEDSKVFSRCLSLLSKNTPYEIVRLISKLDDKKYADVNSLLDADFSPYEAVKIASLDAEKRKKVDFLFEKGLNCWVKLLRNNLLYT